MRFRTLGSHGPRISAVGVGAWAIGGPWAAGWGPQDDQESIAALHHAFDQGINWVDTAAVYGLGHSEEVVGQVLRETTREVLVFTKCGRKAGPDGLPQTDLRPESIRQEADASLKRLGVERIDLYQIHRATPDPGTLPPDSQPGDGPLEDAWGTMAELVGEGKARWIGLSNADVAQLEVCERIHHVDSLQPPLSLINRAALTDLLPWAAANGTGVLAYSPLGSGLLTGAFTRERLAALPADDWRHRSPAFQPPLLDANLALAAALEPIAARHHTTVAAIAVAWVLAQPGVTGAIAGARRPSQVDGWLGAADLELTPTDTRQIAHAVRAHDTAPPPEP